MKTLKQAAMQFASDLRNNPSCLKLLIMMLC